MASTQGPENGAPEAGVEDFPTFFRREFPRLVLHLTVRGYEREADDAAVQAMTAAFDGWAGIERPAAWVRTVALRIAQRAQLQERRRGRREQAYAEQNPNPVQVGPSGALEISEQQAVVLKRIARLSPVRRSVVALAFDGCTVGEIAQQLDIAEATVRSHLRHARRALSETM
jgi:RNA polymerase sigma-70 factor (ECF subfamily)